MKTKRWPKKIVAICNRRLKMYKAMGCCDSIAAALNLYYACDFCFEIAQGFPPETPLRMCCPTCPCFSVILKSGDDLSCVISSKTFMSFKEALDYDDGDKNIIAIRAAARARYVYLRRLFIRKGIEVKSFRGRK